MEGRTENINPGKQLRPWGWKFAPMGEVKNGLLALAEILFCFYCSKSSSGIDDFRTTRKSDKTSAPSSSSEPRVSHAIAFELLHGCVVLGDQRPMLLFWKYFRQKIGGKMAFLTRNIIKLCPNLIIIFEKKVFFVENCRNHRKLWP
jgi:hypothetical protein